MPDANPLLAPWTGPYGGVPPFDRVQVADFEPALAAAMAAHLAEIDRIAAHPEPPTFANTLEALEASGRALGRVGTLYGVWSAGLSTPAFQAAEQRLAPRLAAHEDAVTQHAGLFARIAAVYEGPERAGLSEEQQRLAWLLYTGFVRAGARLDDAAKARLSDINQRLAACYTAFAQRLLADEAEQYVPLTDADDLAGLPASFCEAAAVMAQEKGLDGWAIANTRSSVEPFLTFAHRRDLRERVWRMFVTRGEHGAHRTTDLIPEILHLRFERAQLLGYETHAHWQLEHSMAKTPAQALALMEAVWTPAVARVREEVADMQRLVDAAGERFQIAPWDYRYYAEQVRQQRFQLDEQAVKPYLQLEQLREGMFWVAGQLFGLTFAPAASVPVYHPDVRVWEVRGDGGGLVGLWYFDPYARPGKHSGAWMSAYRSQERFAGAVVPIVSNNANFVPGAPGEPVLVSWDDAETLFHEFGHALHGLLSDVAYPSLAGTNVARDFVEFPSQLLEHWLATPELLSRFAVHHETGAPLPQALVDRIAQAATFNQGFGTVEFLASALVDMQLHLAGGATIEPGAFERDTLEALGMPPELVMRHRLPQFAHVFSSDGYSAAYYSYLWADVLTADAFDAFTEAGSPYDSDVADRLRAHVFTRGNTRDPAELYRAFRGHDPAVAALMRKRGFV